MRHSSLFLLLPAVFALPPVSAADTTPFTVFVSANRGADSRHCGAVHIPCKTFQAGVDRVADRGSVVAIDSGTYGAVRVTQGVTIEAPAGLTAMIETVSGIGVDIQAGAQDTVLLRGLTLVSQNSLPVSVQGIRIGERRQRSHREMRHRWLCLRHIRERSGVGPPVRERDVHPSRWLVGSGSQHRLCGIDDPRIVRPVSLRREWERAAPAEQRNSGRAELLFDGNLIAGAAASAGPPGSSVELDLEGCVMAPQRRRRRGLVWPERGIDHRTDLQLHDRRQCDRCVRRRGRSLARQQHDRGQRDERVGNAGNLRGEVAAPARPATVCPAVCALPPRCP